MAKANAADKEEEISIANDQNMNDLFLELRIIRMCLIFVN